MKVVALISGGKDSCYAMMKCIEYGHQIVALANLLPLDDSVDELDSYMYQTVGHQIILKYADCMKLPLFRRRIHGKSSYQELNYMRTPGDEVEDLMVLLTEVKKHFPDITGVSSGAIASDYQRLRVESVCSRLGLVSLAYLWKQDQDLLLQEMISSNIKAILVKVAVIGLHPNKHLGRDLSDLQAHLLHLKELYGINVCGEGGEYETLTLDCPLFKTARIMIDKYELLAHSSDSIAPVGILHPLEFHLEQKSETMITVMTNEGLTMNNSIDYSVIEVEGDTCVSQKSDSPSDALLLDVDMPKMGSLTCTKTANDRFIIHCWIQPSNNCGQGFRNDFSMVLKGIESKLALNQLGWEDVLYIHVYLADMEQFAVANNIYMTYIKEANCPRGVPSRSTVEAPLGGVLGSVYVEVLASEEKSKRVLHVQSISCWAPSCIGPYSQATLHKKVLYMAGQLGLDPPTMALVAGNASAQTVQALVNCEAVANAFGCSLGSCLIILTVYCSVSLSSQERSDIHHTVNNFLNDKMAFACDSNMTTQEQFHFQPLILYVLVSSLPKRALVEVKPLLCLPIPKRNDLDDEIQEHTTLFAQMEVDDDRVCSDSQMTSIYYKSIKLGGRLFACLVTVPMKALDETGYQKSDRITTGAFIDYNMRKQTECICYIVRECITVLNKNIRNADLLWKNVLVFRVYFAANAMPMDTMQSAFKESAFSEEDIAAGYFSPSFIPIFGSGMDEQMSDLIACELFASCL